MTKIIVLGRFQPFHFGHAHLISAAATKYSGKVTVAIGSAQAENTPENPWSAEERSEMIEKWSTSEGIDIEITCIPDIDDPPNWVQHASDFHGEGILATSDTSTAELYISAGWEVLDVDMHDRINLEGWRVRETLKMLSTVDEKGALELVMQNTLPQAIIEWFLEDDYRIFKLSTIGPDVEPVM